MIMPVIKITHVISCSSEDDRHPASNLVTKKSADNDVQVSRPTAWLIAPCDAKCGQLQADFQLEKASTITHVDIGNYGASVAEIKVGRSCWTENAYVTLLPAFSFDVKQSSKCGSTDAKSNDTLNGRTSPNGTDSTLTSVRMFSTDDFMKDAARQKWDRVRVMCWRPFRIVERLRRPGSQFGLSFLILKDLSTDPITPTRSVASTYRMSPEETGVWQLERDRPPTSSPLTSGHSSRSFVKSGLAQMHYVDDNPGAESRSAVLVRMARAKQEPSTRLQLFGPLRERDNVEFINDDAGSNPGGSKRLKIKDHLAATKQAKVDVVVGKQTTADITVHKQTEAEIAVNKKSKDAVAVAKNRNSPSTADENPKGAVAVAKAPNSPSKVDQNKNTPSTAQHECPICFVSFAANAIETHVEMCLSMTNNNREDHFDLQNTLPDIASPSCGSKGDVSVCPLCYQGFPASEIESHASECMSV